jgi:chorismate mutase/prephenate dehydratase
MINTEMDKQRNKINNIDTEIIKLLAKRRNLSKEIISFKNENKSSIRDKSREKELLTQLIREGKKSGLDSYFVSKVFHEIIDDSVNLQNKIVIEEDNVNSTSFSKGVAVQGIEGSYSFLAANKFFGDSDDQVVFNYKETFEDVVKSVETGETEYAMLPVENTTSGSINDVYDAIIGSKLSIVGEELFHVKHCLVGLDEIPLNKIQKIYTHIQAARQCSKFLSGFNNASVEYFIDTARSAKKIKDENNPLYAAIASEEAAKLFDVVILREGISNQPGNYTRFLIGSMLPITIDERIPAKTSIIMATSQKPGSLVGALSIFRDYNINMTKLQSRPILGNPWEEMFYLDFIGNVTDESVKNLLDELGKHVRFIRVLGCYPAKEIERTKVELPIQSQEESRDEKYLSTIETSESRGLINQAQPKTTASYKLASREYKADDTIVKVGNVLIGGSNFIVIAGPCSVESKDQIMSCAREAKENAVHILRGGCFKPRTSPYSFQGLGYEALQYLKDAGHSYELPVITEVLTIDQVKKVAEHADILQVGARNMQNFALLSEVGKSFRPVMLKRGMMSSLDELLNAAEYINRQVFLCERGIRTFETATRNTLDLSAIPILKERTHLPIVVDPSHAIGQRDKVTPLAKAAKAVGAHGIMVEFHPEPDKALSDGQQSLDFNQLENLMAELTITH